MLSRCLLGTEGDGRLQVPSPPIKYFPVLELGRYKQVMQDSCRVQVAGGWVGPKALGRRKQTVENLFQRSREVAGNRNPTCKLQAPSA